MTTYFIKLKNLSIWKDLLKKKELKHTRRAEAFLSSKLELLTKYLQILKSNLLKFSNKLDQLKPALKMLIKDLQLKLKKELIAITNVKKLLKITKKLDQLDNQIEMLFLKP